MNTRRHFSKLAFAYLIGTAVIYALEFVLLFAVNLINPSLLYSNYETYFLIQMLSMYAISMPLMALIITKMVPVRPSIEKNNLSIGRFIKIFLIVFAAMYLANILGNVLTTAIGSLKGSPVTNDLMELASYNSLSTNLIIMVMIAPCFEEFLFRKLLIDRTIAYGDGISVLISGLFFGLFHGNLNQFAYAFVIGCIFAYVYINTGKVRYTIIMHMLVNFIGSIVAIKMLEISGLASISTEDDITTEQMLSLLSEHGLGLAIFVLYVLVIILIVIIGTILFFMNIKKINFKKTELSAPKGSRFKTYFLSPGMIIFALFWTGKIILQLLF